MTFAIGIDEIQALACVTHRMVLCARVAYTIGHCTIATPAVVGLGC